MTITYAHSNQSRHPSGFTLVELMVAITIFIILTTLTVATFNYNIGSERITFSARKIQATLEGAKSRAYGMSFEQRRTIPVGVRLILDENNPNFVKGMQYVRGSTEVARGTLEFVKFTLNGDNPASPNYPNNLGIRFRTSHSRGGGDWQRLALDGLLRGGTRIRIDGRHTYTISSRGFLPADYGHRTLRIDGTFQDVTNYRYINEPGLASGTIAEYELDFSNVADPLPSATVEEFPSSVVIDLTQSQVPLKWRQISNWIPNLAYNVDDQITISTPQGVRFAVATLGGVSGDTQPDFSSAAMFGLVPDNTVNWQIVPEPKLDIMFSPQGSLSGRLATEGLIMLVLTERIDAEGDPNSTPPIPKVRAAGPLSEQRGAFRIITINPNSGTVMVSPVDFTDTDNDNFADNIFNLALEGAEAK
jgi:prepilin-type N-terminal cleavage/methylation domain-containing protein